MKNVIILATASIALASCGSERSGTIETEDGESVDYSVDTDSSGSTATFNSEDGTATIRSGDNVDTDLPSGFTIYPGAKVVNNMTFDADGSKGTMVIMESADDPQKMVAHYRKQAEAAGFKLGMEMKTDSNTMIAGEAGDGEGGFSFSAGSDGKKTNAQLMVGDSFN